MLYLSQKEFEEMENLSWICNEKPHRDVIHLILHSGAIASQYSQLSKLHKYDILGAVLTGDYKLRASAENIYNKYTANAFTPKELHILTAMYNELKENGFIKEEN
ncbi:hypothetical protein I906_gp60 [Bacillus phage Curly]|uniref:Uncharacterized protein n=1 Tax=Bacillus phage Curly TaxID=2880541 RepID=M1I8L1_9CAUD|nr:hypothetical protein I906_gp60 [Bacillus phage Curly]AGE60747.1 hypothetical protein CURLY_60 [Bacillus phage Curly]